MMKELALSVCVVAAILWLFVTATEASTFAAQVCFAGMSVALFYYYVTNHHYCLAMDTALAKQSLVIGVVAAMPVALLMSPLL